MKKSKVKIVLDADVLIHFSEGECLGLLPTIFEEFDYVVLDYVYEEVLRKSVRDQVQKLMGWFGNLKLEPFAPTGEMMRDYARLLVTRGKGESACMVYCLYHHDVIGSSNLKDIKDFCEEHGIAYLTTFDFLYYALQRGKMTEAEVAVFIENVKKKGSKLPDIDIRHHVPNTQM